MPGNVLRLATQMPASAQRTELTKFRQAGLFQALSNCEHALSATVDVNLPVYHLNERAYDSFIDLVDVFSILDS
jgi:hypothetical protein